MWATSSSPGRLHSERQRACVLVCDIPTVNPLVRARLRLISRQNSSIVPAFVARGADFEFASLHQSKSVTRSLLLVARGSVNRTNPAGGMRGRTPTEWKSHDAMGP